MEDALPESWMKYFFLGHIYLELHMNERAIRIYQLLQQKGFYNSHYIKSQIAIAYHNVQRKYHKFVFFVFSLWLVSF